MTTAPKPGDRVTVTWPVDVKSGSHTKRLRPGMRGTVSDVTGLPWLTVLFGPFACRVYRGFLEVDV